MYDDYDMRRVAPTVCSILGVRPTSSSEKEPLVEVIRTMRSSVRLAVVVIDGFGVSTWAAAREETPTFNVLADKHLLHLRSVMPTITPVNFATMLTGASPDSHKIRVRTERLTLETIFDVMREKGKTSATAARALSSLGILISPLADRPGLAESNTDKEVCSLALKALRSGVTLLWVQLLDVDDAGHAYGPLSIEGITATRKADNHLREIARAAYEGGFGLVVLADHGQHTITRDDGNEEGTHGTNLDEDVNVPFVWCTALELKEALGLQSD